MRLKIEIKMDNAAFEGDPGAECGRILDEIVDAMEADTISVGWSEKLRDINGNTVGEAKVVR